MLEKVVQLLKESYCFIPKALIQNYRKLQLTEKQLIILILLLNEKESIYNPGKISEEISMPLHKVLDNINDLVSKGLVKIEIRKVNRVQEEHIILEPLYKRLAFLLIEEEKRKPENEDIYTTFEKEFGRTLSPMEYEIITDWIEKNYKEELILLALKEAVFNHVTSLSYVERILQGWRKKGIQSKEDVEKEKLRFAKKKEEPKQVFEWDWLHEESNNH